MTVTEVLDLVGIFVFAMSGCLVAIKHRLDLVGLVALGTATGLAGGITRDVLLGDVPPYALRDWKWLTVPLVAAAFVVAFPRFARRLSQPALVFDAAGLGLFATVGATRALDASLSVPAVVFVGTISAVGGGLLRDLLARDVPQIFAPDSKLYSIPAALGALVMVVGDQFEIERLPVQIVAIVVAFALRMGALQFGWHTPIPIRRES